MRYLIIALVAGIIGVIIPLAGMMVSPTRNLILGLAPDEAVLRLADEIDSTRVENLQKIAEMQQRINQLEQGVEEQQKIIDNQSSEQVQINNQISGVNAEQKNQQNCSKANQLYFEIPQNPGGACRPVGPNNIVDMYKETKKGYESAKDDKDKECYKKYLKIVEPAYQEYLTVKATCQ